MLLLSSLVKIGHINKNYPSCLMILHLYNFIMFDLNFPTKGLQKCSSTDNYLLIQLNGHCTCLQYQIGRNIFTREVKSSDMFLSHCTISGHIFVHDKQTRVISNNMLEKKGREVLHNPNW